MEEAAHESEAERARTREGGGEGREGTWQVKWGLVGWREVLAFIQREVGVLEGCGLRRGGT